MLGLLPLILQLALQTLDVVVHAATDQLEPLRVASNVLLGLAASVAARSSRFAGPILLSASGAYLAMNVLFLFQYGVINPNTDALRAPLFGFVIGSLVLGGWQWRRIAGAK